MSFYSDRTGLITVHPELLNQEGKITDEDLLTVRFSNDIEPPKSSNEDSLTESMLDLIPPPCKDICS